LDAAQFLSIPEVAWRWACHSTAKRNGKVGLLLVLCTAAFLRVQLGHQTGRSIEHRLELLLKIGW